MPAFGVVGTGHEAASGLGLFDHQPAGLALGAGTEVFRNLLLHQLDLPGGIARIVAGEGTGRIVHAAKEGAVLPEFDHQPAVFALRAIEPGIHACLDLGHGFAGLVQGRVEVPGEILEQFHPVRIALGNVIQPLFHARGEPGVHEMREMFDQQVADNDPEVRGLEMFFFDPDVVALGQGGDDGRIGRRPADAELLEPVHQGRFGKSGRGLGELLLLVQLLQTQLLSLFKPGQRGGRGVFGLGPDAQEAGEDEPFSLGPPQDRSAGHGDDRVPEAGRGHL